MLGNYRACQEVFGCGNMCQIVPKACQPCQDMTCVKEIQDVLGVRVCKCMSRGVK